MLRGGRRGRGLHGQKGGVLVRICGVIMIHIWVVIRIGEQRRRGGHQGASAGCHVVRPERVCCAEVHRELVGLVWLEGGGEIARDDREINVPKVLLVDDPRADLVADALQLRDLAEHQQGVLLLQPGELEVLDRLIIHGEVRPIRGVLRDLAREILEFGGDAERQVQGVGWARGGPGPLAFCVGKSSRRRVFARWRSGIVRLGGVV